MTATAQMLETHPVDISVDRAKLQACIDACFECAQACTTCADACLSEEMVADLRRCIGLNLDCADVCDATGKVLSRPTAWDAEVAKNLLQACAAACRACGDECGQHASMHEHCKVCAESCRRCEQACNDLLGAL
ncbi:MAG TPA: four-helix bundle copper-binding protein [Nocardioidaceae bacterium]